jgi:glutamyl-tRNA synthetase
MVITRYPPSPTGALHIGGARTAVFNWAFARRSGGAFYLRFEDTDRARSTRASEQEILAGMAWLGIDYDPIPGFAGIPRQSEREERYRALVLELLERGAAYRCVCEPDDVEARRKRALEAGEQPRYDGRCRERGIRADSAQPFCVRLRVPADARTHWNDWIGGPSGQDLALLDDFVVARSDGSPIYHLAVVVDDHDMGVTHVIRGREHLSSTPRQLLLYQALGFPEPIFAHVPLLVDESGKKLSKRMASASVETYRERGFTPEAVLNFIARLGWGSGDVELFSRAEFVQLFTLEGVGKSPSQVHEDKLLWINQHYLKTLPIERLFEHAEPHLRTAAGHPVQLDAPLAKLIELLRPRSRTLIELAERARFALCEQVELEPAAARKHLSARVAPALAALRERLAQLPPEQWSEPALAPLFSEVAAAHGSELGPLAQAVRVAVVGSAASPGIFDTLEVIGARRSLARLQHALTIATGSGAAQAAL